MYKGIIYCATSPSNKKYYGQSIGSLEKRVKRHYSSRSSNDNTIFHNALKKYKDQILWETVEAYEFAERIDLINKLNEREIYWIETNKTCISKFGKEFGYNMTEGGQGVKFYHHTEATKEIIRKKLKGKPKSLESRENYRLANIGENNPMYGKEGELHPRFGKKMTLENKEFLKDLYLDKTFEERHGEKEAIIIKNKISENRRGKGLGEKSLETKEKIKKKLQKRFENQNERDNIKILTRNAMQRPDVKQNLINGIRKYWAEKKAKEVVDSRQENHTSALLSVPMI
jgi:hypothetical protein